MATRDLTYRFKQARSAAKRDVGGASAAGGGGGYDAGLLVAAVPEYVDDVDRINELVGSIRSGMKDLKQLHAERIRAAMGDPQELEMRIDALTRAVTSKFSDAGRKLRALASDSDKAGRVTSDKSIKVNIQRSMAAKLQSMSSEFRKMQRGYLAEVNRAKKASSFDALIGSSSSSAAGGSSAAGDDVDTGLTDEQIEALATAETSTQERDEEIAQIARSIQDLSDLFRDLNILVVDQGTLLDRIDHNVDMTLDSVKAGVTHLESAEKSQKSARPFRCIAILMFAIIIMIIIIAVRSANK